MKIKEEEFQAMVTNVRYDRDANLPTDKNISI